MPDMDLLADQYLHYILVEKGLAKKTITAYSRDIIRYLAFLKKNRIHGIEKTDTRIIFQYLIHLRDQGLATSSRARHLVTLRGFYAFLVQEKYISKAVERGSRSALFNLALCYENGHGTEPGAGTIPCSP